MILAECVCGSASLTRLVLVLHSLQMLGGDLAEFMCDFHSAVTSALTLDSQLAAAPHSVQPAVLRSLLQHTDAGPMLHIKLFELSQPSRAAAAIALCAERLPVQVQMTLWLASKQLFTDSGARRSAAQEFLAMAKDAVAVKSVWG